MIANFPHIMNLFRRAYINSYLIHVNIYISYRINAIQCRHFLYNKTYEAHSS